MDNKRKKIVTTISISAALIALYFILQYILYVTTDNAQVEAHSLMLASKVGGYIEKVNVVENQRVKATDILVEIDERDYRNALLQHRGDLASMEAKRRDAEKTFKRIGELYSKQAVSQQQYDQASATYNDLKSRYDAAAAQVAQAELNLSNTKIRAPSDGFIAKKAAEKGQLAAVGVPLVGFVDSQERWITANFKETELSSIKVGAQAEITIDAIPGKTFKGKVASLSAATGSTFTLLPPDNATGNFTKVVQRVPVRIILEDLTADELEQLRAGLSAFVRVHK